MYISRQKTKEKDQLSKNKKIDIAMELNVEPEKYHSDASSSRKGTRIIISLLIMPILLMLFFICSSNVLAANHYILDGGSGDGSAWNNALDSLPSTLVRGDTYYIGDGNYEAYTFDDAESGSTYIYIKKATASDHGIATGWESVYGDGQAIFTGQLKFQRGYYEFDGSTVSGTTISKTPGDYGFAFDTNEFGNNYYPIQISDGSNVKYIKIKSTHIRADYNSASACIKAKSSADATYITVSHCMFQHYNDALSLDTHGYCTYEYNYFHRLDGVAHGDAIVMGTVDDEATGIVVRYNIFNWNGQQIFFNGGATATFYHKDHEVYGNVFYSDESPAASCAALKQNSSRAVVTGLKAYNNTIYNTYYAVHSNGYPSYEMSGEFKNNICYDVTTINASSYGLVTHDYNYYDTGVSITETHKQLGSNPFNSSGSYDLTLKTATDAGDSTIGDAYNKDMDGNTRGSYGVWDRGAYEKTALSVPSNFRIVSN